MNRREAHADAEDRALRASSSASTGLAATMLAWRQLLRLGNVFTAASNVLAGFLLVQRGWSPGGVLAGLVFASTTLYAAGMALNDAYDAEVDARERSERPVPSGRVSRHAAFAVGWTLLAVGVGAAIVASLVSGLVAPAIVGGCLAAMIVMYDAGLKRTWAGPVAMGWCRFLNVLLGASVAADLTAEPAAWKYAAAIGMYTLGLSCLARGEATDQRDAWPLAWGAAALVGAAGAMLAIADGFALVVPRYAWGALVLLAFAGVGLAWAHAARGGMQRRIQAVVALLRGFVALDALAALAAAGWGAAAIVLALLAPTMIASRRAPMT
ncbi:MAG: UbiA family prenyltransferase [Pirellulales bacterium]|nr:UbiA family prenyltransferase [Pirellulales bacterium]